MFGNYIQQAATGSTGTITLGAASGSDRHAISDNVPLGMEFSAIVSLGDDREIGIYRLLTATTAARVAIKETLKSGVLNRTNPTSVDLTAGGGTIQVATEAGSFISASSGDCYDDGTGIVGRTSLGDYDLANANVGIGNTKHMYPYIRSISGFVSSASIIVGVAAAQTVKIAAYEKLNNGEVGTSYGEFTSSGALDVSTTGNKTATPASPIFIPSGELYLALMASAAGCSLKGVTGPGGFWLGANSSGVPTGSLFRTGDFANFTEDESSSNWVRDANRVTIFLNG
ncbi:hypothetical protein [uncultured Paraglaciecola sp.]|uniref:hypothetical protein n=1 Tax=uncultured Paraglaciecola sp. TaxID=1765024 RepID=UPI00261C88FA|nr:hypothetical protein [uncultured Paraglaciecola sp.]